MLNSKSRFYAGLILPVFFMQFSAYATDTNSNLSEINGQKMVILSFNPSDIKPQCKKRSQHFLIVNKSGYYNSVFASCAENNKFVSFWGWDNGRYTEFTPKMFQYWAELPDKIN